MKYVFPADKGPEALTVVFLSDTITQPERTACPAQHSKAQQSIAQHAPGHSRTGQVRLPEHPPKLTLQSVQSVEYIITCGANVQPLGENHQTRPQTRKGMVVGCSGFKTAS